MLNIPYMDTFKYYYPVDGILSNYYLDLQSKVIKLVDTNGGYN
jgi:hypothetical protein